MLGATLLGQRALSLLALEEDGFPPGTMADLLPPQTPEAPASATLFLEAGIRDDRWGAQRGNGAYKARLDALAQRLEHRGRRERAQAVRGLQKRAEALITAVRALPEEGGFPVLLERAWALFRQYAIRPGEGDVARVLDASLQAALAHARRTKPLSITQRGLRGWLGLLWNGTSLGAEERGVEIVDARQLAGRRVDHLFLVGLEEGRLPEREGIPSLLSDETRALVNRANGSGVFTVFVGEERERAQVARDRLLWVQALGAARDSLTLSFAGGGWGGEAQAPSSWVTALCRQVGVAMPAGPAARFELDAAISEEELRLACARALRPGGKEPRLAAAVRDQLGQEAWLEESQELARVERERLRFFSSPDVPVGHYTGNIPVTAGLREALRFGPERPLSASAVSRWANCAFQGFLTGVLRLEARQLPEDDVDPRLRGAFWHLVLERLVPRLPVGSTRVPRALLEQVLDEAAQALESEGLTCHPALWALARENARAMVLRLAQKNALLPFPAFRPQAVELSFGGLGAQSPWERVRLPAGAGEEEVYLAGQIDRLDGGPEGVAVLDYKTGAAPSLREMEKGLLVTEFQLPLYLYAARASGHLGALHAAWVYVRSGEVRSFDELLARSGQTVDGLVAANAEARAQAAGGGRPNLANAVHGVLQPLREGRFPARSVSCRSCGLEAVCRITERRLEDGP
jgi:RecB family exonuclease